MKNVTKEFGVQDKSGEYIWHPFIWTSTKWNQLRSSHVCIATHTSVDGLFWLYQQSHVWSGPISVAVYAPGSDLGPTIAMINYLRKCYPRILEKTSFHLVYPSNITAYVSKRYVGFNFLFWYLSIYFYQIQIDSRVKIRLLSYSQLPCFCLLFLILN